MRMRYKGNFSHPGQTRNVEDTIVKKNSKLTNITNCYLLKKATKHLILPFPEIDGARIEESHHDDNIQFQYLNPCAQLQRKLPQFHPVFLQ